MKRLLILFAILFLSGCVPTPCLVLPRISYMGMTREQVLEGAIDAEALAEKEFLILECYDPDREVLILDTKGNKLSTFCPGSYAPKRLSLRISQISLTPKDCEILQHSRRWNLNFRYKTAFYGVGYHYCIEIEFDSDGHVFKQRNLRRHFL